MKKFQVGWINKDALLVFLAVRFSAYDQASPKIRAAGPEASHGLEEHTGRTSEHQTSTIRTLLFGRIVFTQISSIVEL